MAQTDPDLVVANARKKYPDYAPMSDDAIKKDLASKHPGAYGYLTRPKWEEPKAAEGPDIVGRTKQALVAEPPAGSRTGVSRALFGERIGSWDTPGRVVRAAGDLFLPGSVPGAAGFAATLPIGGGLLTAPLKRTAASAFAGGVARTAQTGDVTEGLHTAGSQGLSQLAGEVLPGVLRFGLTQKAGAPHVALRAAEEAAYPGKVAERRTADAANMRGARATHPAPPPAATRTFAAGEAATTTHHAPAGPKATDQHAAAVREYEQGGAKTIADAFKQQVPAFKDFPSNEAGLVGMVSGDGPKRMSERFDLGMKDIVKAGRGKQVELQIRDAEALGLKVEAAHDPLAGISPVAREALERAGRLPAAGPGVDRQMFDAGQVAERATGFWKKDHGVYRRVVGALDKADLGDPALRGEYRAGRALLDFAEASQMLKGQKFNPEAARAAFDHVKKLDTLRKRGQGHISTGPIAEAVNRPAPQLTLPAEPAAGRPPITQAFRRPAPLPEVPKPAPLPEGVETKTLPKVSHPYAVGAVVGELPALIGALATGHMDYRAAGIGGLLGTAGALGLSGRTFVTKAPL